MKKIISIVNQKGGVGKTTTSVNLSACLAEQNKKILLIDFDPQGNTTSNFGIDKNNIENSIYDLMTENAVFENCLLQTQVENLDLVPSNINLAGAEIELISFENREFILDVFLQKIKHLYDFIIIDCPPSLNILTLNALCASDSVLIPMQCEYFALEGLSQIIQTINLLKNNFNLDLIIEGIVFTMYDRRTNLAKQVVEEVKNYIDSSMYTEIIPRSVRLSEAPSHSLPITLYDPKGVGTKAYRKLAKQVLKRR